jgi:hypothetical protein
MIRTMTVLVFILGQTAIGAAAATCAGANPAITSVAVKNVTSNGSLNDYHLVGTVTNLGSMAQSRDVLQFVDIYAYGEKKDSRGIPPLAPGQSSTFSYLWQRSVGAGNGTTTLDFRIAMHQGEDCNPANGTYHVTF